MTQLNFKSKLPAALDIQILVHKSDREALRADSSTSRLADTLVIGVVGSTAVIRGVVDDLDDGDSIVDVVGRVDGIDEVRDETVFEGL
jgi:hypothetical protein